MPDYITREGMHKLHKRIHDLIEERKEVIKQVVTAREMGDLSENAEYKAAREKQRNIEKEYNHIKYRITRLHVIDISEIPKDAVRFGAYVTIKDISDNKIFKQFLVGIDEIYETENEYERISIASPIGKSMIGKKVGENFLVKAPRGKREFIILDIK